MSALQRLVEQRLGLPGVAGVALMAAALAFWGAGVRPAAQALEEQRAEAARSRTDRVAAARPQGRSDGLAEFYEAFAAPSDALPAIQAIFEAAAKERVAIETGEYRLSRERSARFVRYQVAFPVKGGYGAVRRFVARSLNAVPGLALDDLAMRRDSIAATTVDARVQFTLYVAEAA